MKKAKTKKAGKPASKQTTTKAAPAPVAKPEKKAPVPREIVLPKEEIYYDSRGGGYWYRMKNRFLNLPAADIKMHLKNHGYSDQRYVSNLDELTWQICNAQNNRVVDYAGPLAGHRVGISEMGGGMKVLVTREPQGIWDDLPKVFASPDWFIAFVQELLPGDQWLHFCHWLRIALESMRAINFSSGQAVVFAGDSGSGKSLIQLMITAILGGRFANPWKYMMGSSFNYAMAGAEHWMVQDPATTTDLRARRAFGNKLKECSYNKDFGVEQKGKDEIPLRLFRRTTVSVNLELENLAVVPPLDDSLRDKIFLFKCDPAVKALSVYLDSTGKVNEPALWGWVEKNLVNIRAWLLTGLPMLPRDMVRGREGILAWQHPELFMQICELSPELRLLHLMDETLWAGESPEDRALGMPFVGKAIEIEKKIRASEFSFEVEKLLKSSGSSGAYLGRLAKSYPDRISKMPLKHGYQEWKISKPKTQSTTE